MTDKYDDSKTKEYIIQMIQGGKIDIHVAIYYFNVGVEAYKYVQELLIKIDKKIHTEFAYCARAFASYIQSDGKDQLALADSFQSSRHILNDSLDLLVGYATEQTALLSDCCRDSDIQDVYPDFEKNQISALIKELHKIIAESRRERGLFRLEEYEKVLKGEKYKILFNYCQEIPDIWIKMKKKKRAERRKSLYLALGVIVSLPASLWAILQMIKHFSAGA